MLWHDLLLDRWLDGPSLARALAAVFQIEPRQVRVVDEITPTLDVNGLIVLAERTRRLGDFPLQLGVYVRDDDLWQRVQPFGETVRLVRQMCQAANSACLITGPASEPELDLLVRPSGEVLQVTLDENRLDLDEFVVTDATPFTEVVGRTA